jgi:galactose mutarotase-like enzyme
MLTIENEHIRAVVASKGAELQQLFSKDFQLEYIWGGDPAYWAKHSPVLFPIVGSLKKDTYFFNNQPYHMGRHGFARDMVFLVEDQQFDQVGFLLKSSPETLNQYPFPFEFRVGYRLRDNYLETSYKTKNTGTEPMYFSVGGHPAFKLPLVKGTSYEDYFLEFNEEETLPRWPISKDGLIEKRSVPLLQQTNVLPLTRELFFEDALVTKYPTSSIVSIRSDKTEHGLDFQLEGFPYLGIWAARNADFVCIEPWCGIADNVDADQQLVHKEGIIALNSGGTFERSWMVRLF